MKISQMRTKFGTKIANQFIINDSEFTSFQSYNSVIVKTTFENGERVVYLDKYYYNYSKTTAKYRNLFLGCTSKECEQRIKDGVYILTDLN
jgi:hypothetical protein